MAQPAAGEVSLPHRFSIQSQNGYEFWCWAAVASSVAAYYGLTGPQYTMCALASYGLNLENPYLNPGNATYGPPENCCESPTSTYCNRPCDVRAGLHAFGADGRLPQPNALPPNEIEDELSGNQPIIAQLNLGGGAEHVVVIGAIIPGSPAGPTQVYVLDPEKPPSWNALVPPTPQSPGSPFFNVWQQTFFVVRPPGLQPLPASSWTPSQSLQGIGPYVAGGNDVPIEHITPEDLSGGDPPAPVAAGTLTLNETPHLDAIEYDLAGRPHRRSHGLELQRLVDALRRHRTEHPRVLHVPSLGIVAILFTGSGEGEMVETVYALPQYRLPQPRLLRDLLPEWRERSRHRAEMLDVERRARAAKIEASPDQR